MSTIIVGIILVAILIFSGYKTMKSLRSGSCPGCSAGGCSTKTKSCCSGHKKVSAH